MGVVYGQGEFDFTAKGFNRFRKHSPNTPNRVTLTANGTETGAGTNCYYGGRAGGRAGATSEVAMVGAAKARNRGFLALGAGICY